MLHGWGLRALFVGMGFTTLMIGGWVVLVSVILGLVRAVVRRPVRVEGESGVRGAPLDPS